MYFKVNDYLFLRDNMRYIKMQEPNLKNLLNQYPFTCSSLTLKATRGEHAIFFKCKNLSILIPPLNYRLILRAKTQRKKIIFRDYRQRFICLSSKQSSLRKNTDEQFIRTDMTLIRLE